MTLHSNSYGVQNPVRIFYGTEEWQFGDLRLPQKPGPHPVIVPIHGGFWRARYGLDLMDKMAVDFAARGFATWNIEYRRVGHPGGGWLGTLQDVSNAIDYLHEIAEEFQLDLERVVTIGHSAGGHLSLWLGARHRLPGDVWSLKTERVPLVGVVSLAGVTDLRRMHQIHVKQGRDSPVATLLGAPPAEVPERVHICSPIELLPLGTPQVIIQGVEDDTVPVALADTYVEMARQHGDEVRYLRAASVEHFQVIDPDSEVWPHIVRMTTALLGSDNQQG